MAEITFADVVHQSVSFSKSDPAEKLILALIDDPWVQRLRDISQTANTRLVYMFSEHSRFGHSLGVAYMANNLMKKLADSYPDQVKLWRPAVLTSALLHDIGHLAPGSHTAHRTWFPNSHDNHEETAARIILGNKNLHGILAAFDKELPTLTCALLSESTEVPPWAWQIISGGGWNVDRGNWCIVDSIMAGVSYGRYNITALTDAMMITSDGHLAVRETRLDAMTHFALSRHAMYRQLYQHRVILAADTINRAIAQRARDLVAESGKVPFFADSVMAAVLAAKSSNELTLETIFQMRESWWRYHLMQWRTDSDPILSDLARRLLDRDLFKTIKITTPEDRTLQRETTQNAVRRAGFDPRYYLHEVEASDSHANEESQAMPVVLDDGSVHSLTQAEPLLYAMMKESGLGVKGWFVVPDKVKSALGMVR